MQVVVKRKDNYGTERFYPMCPKAEIFARIACKKTFGRRELFMIKELGYEVVVKQDEVAI